MRPSDMPENYYFGGAGATMMTPLSLLVLGLAVLFILFLPRRHIIIPLLLAALLIPLGNQWVFAGVHFMTYRLLLLAGWMRVAWLLIFTKDRFPRLNPIDKVLLAWAFSNAILYSILWSEWEAVLNRMGFLYSTLGAYFLLRFLIRDPADVRRTIKTMATVMALIAPLVLWEHLSGTNLFSNFGGVAEVSAARNGQIRAQGPFAHPIVAGTCGAMLIPLFISLWWYRGSRLAATVGILAATAIVLSCSSSTPLMTYAAGLAALCAWPLRYRMRTVRWALLLGIIGIHLLMKAPVWFLISRASGILGGTGWHRAELIDQFIRHFDEWWFIGTRNNAYWGVDMWDAVNGYVNAGITGGLLTLVLWIGVLVVSYRMVGRLRAHSNNKKEQLRIWAVGAALFANTVAFFGIVYFDQSAILWYAVLAIIPASGKLMSPVASRALSMNTVREHSLRPIELPALVATGSGVSHGKI